MWICIGYIGLIARSYKAGYRYWEYNIGDYLFSFVRVNQQIIVPANQLLNKVKLYKIKINPNYYAKILRNAS